MTILSWIVKQYNVACVDIKHILRIKFCMVIMWKIICKYVLLAKLVYFTNHGSIKMLIGNNFVSRINYSIFLHH